MRALAFKIINDQFGTLTFVRMYSGVVKKGDTLLNVTRGRKERIGRIVEVQANHVKDIDETRAGDICAFVSMKDTETGDSLCDPDHPALLERMRFPDPVISVSVGAQDARRRRQDDHRALQDGACRSVAAPAGGPGDRPDRAARHGRAAPGDHHRPHAHRTRRRSQHGQAQGELSRGLRHAARAHLHAQEADRRLRPVRRGQDGVRAAASRAAASSSPTRSSAGASRANSSRRSSTRSAPRASRARSPATRWWTSRRG